MTKYVVQVLPEVEQEFREAFFWYLERSPIAADAFRTLVFEAIDSLAERTTMWPKNPDGAHKLDRAELDRAFVRRIVNLITLAPDIVSAILNDSLPDHVTFFDLASGTPLR